MRKEEKQEEKRFWMEPGEDTKISRKDFSSKDAFCKQSGQTPFHQRA